MEICDKCKKTNGQPIVATVNFYIYPDFDKYSICKDCLPEFKKTINVFLTDGKTYNILQSKRNGLV